MKRIRFAIPEHSRNTEGLSKIEKWLNEHGGPRWSLRDLWLCVWLNLPYESKLVAQDEFSVTYLVPDDWKPYGLPPIAVTLEDQQ